MSKKIVFIFLLVLIIISINLSIYYNSKNIEKNINIEAHKDTKDIQQGLNSINKILKREVYGEFNFEIEKLNIILNKSDTHKQIILNVKLIDNSVEAKIELLVFANELRKILIPEIYYVKSAILVDKDIKNEALNTKDIYDYYDGFLFELDKDIKMYVQLYKIYQDINDYYIKSFIEPINQDAKKLDIESVSYILEIIKSSIIENNITNDLFLNIKEYNAIALEYKLKLINENTFKKYFKIQD